MVWRSGHGDIEGGDGVLHAMVAEKVRFVGEIPKTPSGKVLRRLLAERETVRTG
jgi:acyl-coenzyme A synthetase/AMP-(fatty) acid ligase